MKNLLLGIIAINLTIISINLTLRSIEPVQASSYDITTALNKCGLYAGPAWNRSQGKEPGSGFRFQCASY